jgi:hypothetical protein
MSERQRLRRSATAPTVAPTSTTAQAAVTQGTARGGSPLGTALRSQMEGRFGHDFSRVRIHTDARADESAQAVQARAFTVGNDIVFRAGQFNPQSTDSQHLLAHELTHVVQQEGVSAPAAARAPMEVSQPGDPAEVEAEAVAREVMDGKDVATSGTGVQRALLQREGVPEEEEELQM